MGSPRDLARLLFFSFSVRRFVGLRLRQVVGFKPVQWIIGVGQDGKRLHIPTSQLPDPPRKEC